MRTPMLNSAKIKEWMDSAADSISEQQWFQELRGKWEELDPQSRNYVKLAAFGASVLSVFFVILSALWSVHSLNNELSEKRALLDMIQSANDELRMLKSSIPGGAGAERESSWASYFESSASTSGLDRSSLNISTEKPGNSTDQTKEAMYDISIKHISIKQLVRYVVALENGQRPVKFRNMQIETKGDSQGYLDVNLALSAFTIVEPK